MKIFPLMVAAAATLIFATNVHAQGARAKKAAQAVITPILQRMEHSSGHGPDWMEWLVHAKHSAHPWLEHWEQGWRDGHEKREPENRTKEVQ